jgi:3-methyladenine DNA glycosylase AlkD
MSLVHDVLARLEAAGDPAAAVDMARYHKTTRRVLGVKVPVVDTIGREASAGLSVDARVNLADGLWRTDVHEARVLAAKLLDVARMRPDDAGAWALIVRWVPDFDGWALADHACIAGQKRVVADPRRLDEVGAWTRAEHLWTRRAALVITLPWARLASPTAVQRAERERVLGWAAGALDDRAWFMQKAVSWWLRELSRRDPERVRAFVGEHGARMLAFARRDALRRIDGSRGAAGEEAADGG